MNGFYIIFMITIFYWYRFYLKIFVSNCVGNFNHSTIFYTVYHNFVLYASCGRENST